MERNTDMRIYRLLLIFALLLGLILTAMSLTACDPAGSVTLEKPVIYLYPESTVEVHVQLDFDGQLTTTIPAYPADGWIITASPDGTLTDGEGNTYPYLFWEGVANRNLEGFSEGFCVKGSETEAFLYSTLTEMGLNTRETTDFVEYWLPRMEGNSYNLIRFCGADYTDMAELTITPAPDSVLRVFMMFEASECYVAIPEQSIEPFERDGFTVVEWGGCELKKS